MSTSWIWSDKITNKRLARVGYNQKQNKQKYFIHISLLHDKKKDIYMGGYKSY